MKRSIKLILKQETNHNDFFRLQLCNYFTLFNKALYRVYHFATFFIVTFLIGMGGGDCDRIIDSSSEK